ncbi:MFS transporter [Lelliottia amnigena]
MNTLLYALFEALRRHRWLRMLACAFVFTSLGNGLTQVVIFGLLLSWKAPASLLTVAYLFATLPGFIGSLIGEKLCRFYSPVRLLILAELLGLTALLFPLLGIHYHSVTALLAVQSTEALLTGMSWPALTLLFKRALTTAELPAATCLENVIFASQVLLGMGLGIVLFDYLSVLTLLAIDAASFVGSLVMLLLAGSALTLTTTDPVKITTPEPLHWKKLSRRQKRSLLLLPALAAVGAPAMALLPALAQYINPTNAAGLALPLLFARSLGQLCGPMMMNRDSLPRYANRNRPLLTCLSIFLLAYGLLPLFAGVQTAALGMIFVAHLASNIVFAAGTYGVLSHFETLQVSAASGKAWRWQTLSASVFTCFAATLASTLGAVQALYIVSASALIIVAAVMARYRE